MSGSNTRPLVLETTALPTELIPYKLAPPPGLEPGTNGLRTTIAFATGLPFVVWTLPSSQWDGRHQVSTRSANAASLGISILKGSPTLTTFSITVAG